MSSNPPSRSGPDRDGPPRIALAPEGAPGWMHDAVVAGGGHVVPVGAAEGLVWAAPRDPERLDSLLADAPELSWVQLPFAGIESFTHLLDDDHLWTCGKGVYAEPVAEMALSLALAGMRHVGALCPGLDVGVAEGPQPARGERDDPRRRRDHRVAAAPVAPVRLPRHRRAQPRHRDGRRRRRARGRPLRRRARRRRSRRARAVAHPGDRGDDLPFGAGDHGAPRVAW